MDRTLYPALRTGNPQQNSVSCAPHSRIGPPSGPDDAWRGRPLSDQVPQPDARSGCTFWRLARFTKNKPSQSPRSRPQAGFLMPIGKVVFESRSANGWSVRKSCRRYLHNCSAKKLLAISML